MPAGKPNGTRLTHRPDRVEKFSITRKLRRLLHDAGMRAEPFEANSIIVKGQHGEFMVRVTVINGNYKGAPKPMRIHHNNYDVRHGRKKGVIHADN